MLVSGDWIRVEERYGKAFTFQNSMTDHELGY
jgi:hypothetical protein